VIDSSYALPSGERVLELSATIPASLEDTWRMFTTSKGYGSWASPFAVIDLRVGGQFETSYALGARAGDPGNIRNRIIALVPLRLVVVRNEQAQANQDFDLPTFQKLQTAVHFRPVNERETRVTVQNAGYLLGANYDGVYKFFRVGNTWVLQQLRERFEKGPTVWSQPSLLESAKTAQ
jgi:uncharacterized protein YndB with AHSA1/START domain